MSAIRSPAFVELADRLFAAADDSKRDLMEQLGRMPSPDRAALFASADQRALYAYAKDAHLAVSRETATLLYMLARASNARGVVEFGTSFGISTMYLAAAVQDNGGGRVIGSEYEPSKAAVASRNLDMLGFGHLVEIRDGDALTTLAQGLPETVDMLFLDGADALYRTVLLRVERSLRPGSLIVADNADGNDDYLSYVRSSGDYISVRSIGTIEISLRV